MPRPTAKPSAEPSHGASQRIVVSHIWLLKAVGLTVVAAAICGYLTLCLLFYQGQWQLVLHPQRAAATAPDSSAAPALRFGPDESATPQLTGRWLPASPGVRNARTTTILFLPSGDASLSHFNSRLDLLHSLGLNVFAFDYRGFGSSADMHPRQSTMTQDADSAWTYLTASRGNPGAQIIPYGVGVGASLATHLAATHHEIPAVILESPKGDLLDEVLKDPRSGLLPVRLLFHETFPLAVPLAHLGTPKLLISTSGTQPTAFRTAADPKLTLELATPSDALYIQTLTRFLDQYTAGSPH